MITADVLGEEGLRRTLEQLLPREVKAVARRTLTKLAADLRDEIRSRAPVDRGTLKRAIRSGRERGARDEAAAAVWITKGKQARHDAFYWHFVEFGTVSNPARPFIVPAVESFRGGLTKELGDELMRQIVAQFAKRTAVPRR